MAGAAWSLSRGASVLPGDMVRFAVWAPAARAVAAVVLGGGGARET